MKAKVLEIKNDAFYFKQTQMDQHLMFAYLHLSGKVDEMFLAIFESADVAVPSIYRWNENDVDTQKKSRHLIIEFIGEAYMSMYIKCKIAKLTDKPLWEIVERKNSIIPLEWYSVIENIKM